jgi:hypothetical protein
MPAAICGLACSGDDPGAAVAAGPTAPRADFVRNCASRVEGGTSRTNRRRDLIAGAIVFRGIRESASIARSTPNFFRAPRGRAVIVKTVTEVAAGKRVLVFVPPQGRRDVRLFYDATKSQSRGTARFADSQRAVAFMGCDRDEPSHSGSGTVGRVTQFNGGFVIARPTCLVVGVVEGSQRAPRIYRLPFGRSCAR